MELAKDQALSDPETAAETDPATPPEAAQIKAESPLETAAATGAAASETPPGGKLVDAAQLPVPTADGSAAATPAPPPISDAPSARQSPSTLEPSVRREGPDAGSGPPGQVSGGLVARRSGPRAPHLAPPVRPEPRHQSRPRSRAARYGMLAASIALAISIGAAAGAAGFATMAKLSPPPQPAPAPVQKAENSAEIKALRDSVAQLRSSMRTLNEGLSALRTGNDNAGKATQAQIARLNEAIERLEKAQAEPNAKLAKITEALDRIDRRAAPPAPQTASPAVTQAASQVATPAPSQAPSPETTGSTRPAPLPPLQRSVVSGWTLIAVENGVALVQSRVGAYEVIVGDDIRGLGRVQDIRRQDGRWVVVTNRGLIVPQR